MGEIIKPGAVLLLITLVAGICLGCVYNVTKEPIRIQQEKVITESRKELFPNATEFKEDIEVPAEGEVKSAVTAYENENIAGYIIGVAPKGYSGEVETLVALDPDGVILGIKIVKQTETPGLGTKATEPEFSDQYIGKSGELTVTKSGKPTDTEIQAITSATITSKAVTRGVNAATDFYNNNIK